MKILHLNTSDSSGGAANAAARLHKALIKFNVKSLMMVQEKLIDSTSTCGPENNLNRAVGIFRPYLDRLPMILYGKSIKSVYHFGWVPDLLLNKINLIKPDIIHLHWICGGFVNIHTIKKINRPIVWTFHDMWPFTGGCHISMNCESYKKKCGYCPQLESKRLHDISFFTLARKKRNWSGLNINVVTPSRWLARCAEDSTIFRKIIPKIIHNGVDLNRFRPFDKGVSREFLNLPREKKIVLFGSIKGTVNQNKGFNHLVQALKAINTEKTYKEIALVLFGDSGSDQLPKFEIPVYCFGHLHDDISISMLYSAADVFVLPTIQDNLPNTLIESMACGIPCVSYDVGGVSDIIEHRENGYLANSQDINDLAHGIKWVFEDEERYNALSGFCRKTAENKFNIDKVAQQYIALYNTLI